MPQKSLWHGFEPMPLASEASLAGCDQFRPRHQPLIHDGGRRCGDARFGNDTASAICSGCEPDGRLRISEPEVRARCAADARAPWEALIFSLTRVAWLRGGAATVAAFLSADAEKLGAREPLARFAEAALGPVALAHFAFAEAYADAEASATVEPEATPHDNRSVIHLHRYSQTLAPAPACPRVQQAANA